MTAEMQRAARVIAAFRVASMRPRSNDRGNIDQPTQLVVSLHASMRPRSNDRGNVPLSIRFFPRNRQLQ